MEQPVKEKEKEEGNAVSQTYQRDAYVNTCGSKHRDYTGSSQIEYQ